MTKFTSQDIKKFEDHKTYITPSKHSYRRPRNMFDLIRLVLAEKKNTQHLIYYT